MPAPLIGVSCGTSALDIHAQTQQDRLNQAYSLALAAAGAIPVILPNLPDPVLGEALLERLDGLLVSGGADVAPALYGEEILNETVKIDAARDTFEIPLLRAAVRQDLPLLAICRGIQVLNVALGGSLYQDIPAQVETETCHSQMAARHVATHAVRVASGTRVAEIVGAGAMAVNSFHHQALKTVAGDLQVVARAEDDIVEAVEIVDRRFCIGVQFHPEEMVGDHAPARRLFAAFAAAAADR